MKTLYESILSSTNSGTKHYLKDIFKNPEEKNIEELDKLWKSLDLEYKDKKRPNTYFGYWKYSGLNNAEYVVCIKMMDGTVKTCSVAFLTKWGVNDLFVDLDDHGNKVNRDVLINWSEKIAKTLGMNVRKEKKFIYLNFVK